VITISGTPTATGTFTYTIPLTGTSCSGLNATGTITVAAACAAGAASSTPTPTVNTLMTNITHTTTSATGIGTASGLPAGVTATWASNVITISGTPTATGTFTYTIPLTGTSCSGVNATGTITVSAACGSVTSVTDVDGNIYKTVAIGTQIWMAENLKVTKYKDGVTAIPDETSGSWSTLTTGALTNYTGATGIPSGQTYFSTYGYLYNWYAVNNPNGLCPLGWHVPTDVEWTTLFTYLGGESVAGGKMKSTSSLWNSFNTGADNSSCFTGLPGGWREENAFYSVSFGSLFWSATENDSGTAFNLNPNRNNGSANRGNSNKKWGGSVRCLKD
jgi:uncharacterized protein (TIGR02145 family)